MTIDPKQVVNSVKSQGVYIDHNAELIDIADGNLLPYLLKELRKQLSQQSYDQIIHRLSAVNILPKVVDKLTNIYQMPISREVVGGAASDSALLSWYEEQLNVNDQFNASNELFNLCKSSLIHPYVDKSKPHLRVIQNNKMALYSDDPVCPEKPTQVTILAGKKGDKDLYRVYTDAEFKAVLSDETIDAEEMDRIGNKDGVNPYGALPFVYVNSSKYKLLPTQDTDVVPIVLLVAIMFSDLNLAAMFQSFSILYLVDADPEKYTWAPNAIWTLKTDAVTNKTPSIQSIKPDVDFDQVIKLIGTQLSMWLETKGIKAGTMGQLSVENLASGIAKIIDEMDTYEARQKQVTAYQQAEAQFWDLLLNKMHPYWVENSLIENRTLFSPGAKIKTTFSPQLPTQNRGQLVKDLDTEVKAKFTTRKRAISKLNPTFTEKDVDALMVEIDAEAEESQPIEETAITDATKTPENAA